MARKAAKQQGSGGNTASPEVEQGIIKLAEQLGGFLGRVQRRADGMLDNETLKAQVAQIRDGANSLLQQVNQSTAAVKKMAAPKLKSVTEAASNAS